ncbi:mitochondrial lysine-tRNA synthetase [Conoideocrella luteorostrata]|uniref:Lysyl-tRNA synthetase n=1 Tax=Conoideocrella luteorostrata TaxID=1105319 RepID=A0AAJ0CLC2_9HYPO|nr:mitochondrial lysine-tRNA synthetase [Conoideocrella luteorostrata]
MRYSLCLRLARQSAVSQKCALRSIGGLTHVGSTLSLQARSGCAPFQSGARALSSGSDSNKASRFSAAHDASETLSPFKQHRKDELREDQESENPLYPDPYPRLDTSMSRKSVPEFLEEFEEQVPSEAVTLTGRIRSKRVVGKSLIFLDIVNEFQKVQIMINKNKCVSEQHGRMQKFSLFKNLIQIGDHISVIGHATRTKAGEPTLEVTQLPELVSPSMEQIPEKLTDPKTRMAERHVDMLVNKEVVDVLRLRAEITKYMRDHFHSKRFLEFQTPILAENAGGAIARPFVTQATEFRNKDLALRIAPELWLKRLVIGGVDRVFEIGPAFRNEGVDATHNPEFTMCEFYSAYTNLPDLIKETEELLHGLAKHAQDVISTQLTTLPPIDLSRFVRPFRQVEFIPGLEASMGIRFPKLSAEDALPELLAMLKLAGITIPGEVPNSLPKLLDRLAAVYLEPMSFTEPLFITNHPACMSPLAKGFLCPQTYQLVSARAELFVGGRELANMYEEENDPEEQKRKLATHRSLVNKPDGEVGFAENSAPQQEQEAPVSEEAEQDEWDTSPLDQSYVKALDYGLPPTGGWGCGVERLVMLFSGANRISDCLSFGTLRNVVGLSSEDKPAEKDS